MTEQEIEKLREKLGSDYSVKRLNGAVTVELADIWEGVEFYENHLGTVKPISESFRNEIKYGVKFLIHPSTESAYVEQLKAKAKELYGEIKNGDRFDLSGIDPIMGNDVYIGNVRSGFKYDNTSDVLYFGDIPVFKQGEWAKKIEEPISNRVSVEPINCSISTPDYRMNAFDQSFEPQEMSFSFSVQGIVVGIKHTKEIANHLSETLQSYLNKIP